MRKLAAAMLSSFLAFVLGGAGIVLMLWLAAALYHPEWAREWAVAAMEHSPLPTYAPPPRVAGDLLQNDALLAVGLGAALLCVMALPWLRSARQALRSDDESHDGKGTIELKKRPLRVGQPVEGSIWLAQGSEPGELYRVELSCTRGGGSGRSGGAETAYSEELEVAPLHSPVGWRLPFRFVVPPIAPPSGASRHMSGPGYRWRLAFRRSQGWISFPSVFALNLAPAPLEELRALEKKEAPAQKLAVDEIVRSVGREPALHERVQPQGLSTFENVTPGSARAHGTVAYDRSTDDKEGGTGDRQTWSRDPLAGWDRAADQGRVSDTDRLRVTGGQIPEGPSSAPRRAPETASLPGKIVRWLFLVVFGGVLAVSAVALVTAALLAYVF